MADIVAHRYRAAAQIEAPYCLSCWRDFFAEQEHDFDDSFFFILLTVAVQPWEQV